MIWKFLVDAAIYAASYIIDHYAKQATDMVSVVTQDSPTVNEYQDEIQLAQLKLQYLQHEETLASQDKLAQLSHERAKELEVFRQQAEDLRLEKNLDFQHWRLEQEKVLQLEILEKNHALQRELVAYSRQTSLKVIEEQKRLENSPIWLVASDILHSHTTEKILPLRVFFAPPTL